MARTAHVKKGDLVYVTTGDHSREGDEARKNRKGRTGKVLAVLRKKNQVIVEGVNFIRKHTRKSPKNEQGGIVEREGPIHISNVRLVQDREKSKSEKGAAKKEKAAKSGTRRRKAGAESAE